MKLRFVLILFLVVQVLTGRAQGFSPVGFEDASANPNPTDDKAKPCKEEGKSTDGLRLDVGQGSEETLMEEVVGITRQLAMNPRSNYPSIVEIDEQTYKKNIEFFSRELEFRGKKLCAVLKNDGYGHGVRNLAKAAVDGGASYLAIVDNQEAKDIRSLGISCPVIRIRTATLGEIVKTVEEKLNVEELVGSMDQALFFSDIGIQTNKKIPVHLHLDVGMGRMGIDCNREKGNLAKICSLPGIEIVGIMTHFSEADKSTLDTTRKQLAQFQKDLKEIIPQLPPNKPLVIHSSNSAAALRVDLKGPIVGKDSFMNEIEKLAKKHAIPITFMARMGTATYGLVPLNAPIPSEVGKTMSFKSQVSLVRDMPVGSTIGYHVQHRITRPSKIATIPVGSANGIEYGLPNKGHVLIGGKRRLILGVTAHMIMVDVTDDGDTVRGSSESDVKLGDEVVIIGKQGQEEIRAEDVAALVGSDAGVILGNIGRTNPYRVIKSETPLSTPSISREWRRRHSAMTSDQSIMEDDIDTEPEGD